MRLPSTQPPFAMWLKILSIDVAEVYSPPRVAIEASKFGLKPGWSMDLTTGWDFRKIEDRRKAKEYADVFKPILLVGSPMCTMFSRLQSMSKLTEEKEAKWIEVSKKIYKNCVGITTHLK